MVSTKLRLQRLLYAPGDAVCLSGEVVNDTNKMLRFYVVLTQLILIRDAGHSPNAYSCRTFPLHYDLFQSTIPAQSVVSIQELTGIEQVQIPLVYPSFNGGVPEPHTPASYPCVRWSYTLEIRAGRSRDTEVGNAAVYCRVPILVCRDIGTPPHDPNAAARIRSPVATADPFSFLDIYALTKFEESEIAPASPVDK